MNLIKGLTSLPDMLRGWFAPARPVPAGALKASGNAMAHLAETLADHAEEWEIGTGSVSRKGMEVGWKGSLDGVRTRIYVKMDGAQMHVTPVEAALLKDSLQKLLKARTKA